MTDEQLVRQLVLDSSAAVALLVDSGGNGEWVAATVGDISLAAPELLRYEVGNVLRRQVLAGELSPAEATLAHEDLLELPVDVWPYPTLARRVWDLRDRLTVYDASFVALAELLGAPLVTLDRRLACAPGLSCSVLVPDPPR